MESQPPLLQYLPSMFPELFAWLSNLGTDSNTLLLIAGGVTVFILAVYLIGKIIWRLTLWVVVPLVLMSLLIGGETVQNFFNPVLKALGAGEALESVQQAFDADSNGQEESSEEAQGEAKKEINEEENSAETEEEAKKPRRRTGPGR